MTECCLPSRKSVKICAKRYKFTFCAFKHLVIHIIHHQYFGCASVSAKGFSNWWFLVGDLACSSLSSLTRLSSISALNIKVDCSLIIILAFGHSRCLTRIVRVGNLNQPGTCVKFLLWARVYSTLGASLLQSEGLSCWNDHYEGNNYGLWKPTCMKWPQWPGKPWEPKAEHRLVA